MRWPFIPFFLLISLLSGCVPPSPEKGGVEVPQGKVSAEGERPAGPDKGLAEKVAPEVPEVKEAAPAPLPQPVVQPPQVATVPPEEPGELEYIPVIDPKNPRSMLYLGAAGRLAGRGGSPEMPASEVIRRGRGWHPAVLAAEGLPKDRFGFVDWAEATRKGLLDPKPFIEPGMKEPPPFKFNVVIKTKSESVNNVLFPHEMHTWWLGCDACHPAIFLPKAGFNDMTMVSMVEEGRWCGKCHGKVAFPLQDCARCHTVPREGAAQPVPATGKE